MKADKYIECRYCGESHRITDNTYYCSKVFGGRVNLVKRNKPKAVKAKTFNDLMRTAPEPVRMSYETYAYLKDLLEVAIEKCGTDFRNSCRFIPPEEYDSKKKSGVAKAHDIYMDMTSKLEAMKKELKDVAVSTYEDHPNPAMRKFWGLPE